MKAQAIDEMTDTTAKDESYCVGKTVQFEFQAPPTEKSSLQVPNAIVSNDSIQSNCSQKNGKNDLSIFIVVSLVDFRLIV